jgi:hypothetical protein
MPRQIVEELVGYRFGVGRRTLPPDQATNGTPAEQTVIEFVDVQPTHAHVVRVPLDDQAREELARLLTGGIHIARRMPGGIDL